MTGPELVAKIICRLLNEHAYDAEWEGDTVYLLRRTNPEHFKIKVTVEKKKLGLLHPEI